MTNEINIFNRNLLKQRRSKAAASIDEHDFIIDTVSGYIIESLEDSGKHFETALNIGCHTGILGKKIMAKAIATQMFYADLSLEMAKACPAPAIVLDEEFLPFAEKSFNLIASAMSLHWVNDLPGCLLQIRKSLKEEGIFIAAMPGLQTLQELRHCLMEAEIEITGGISPHISPFSDVKTMGHLLGRAGFRNPVADSENITVSYENMFSLMKDIKSMGENNAMLKRSAYLRRDVLTKAAEKYQQQFGNGEGGIVATIEIITITGLAA